jgi:outer membrane protein assembly factor BamB
MATSVVAGAGKLYVARADGRLLVFDAASGARVASVVPRVEGGLFAMAGGRLLALTDDGVAAVAPDSGRAVWKRDLGTRGVNAAVLAGDTVWAHAPDRRTGRDRLFRLDARTGRLEGSLPLREFGVAGLAPVGREVWIVSPKGHLVVVE